MEVGNDDRELVDVCFSDRSDASGAAAAAALGSDEDVEGAPGGSEVPIELTSSSSSFGRESASATKFAFP